MALPGAAVGVTAVHRGLAQAARRRQVPDVKNHPPHIIIGEDAPRRWHAGRVDAILDNPLQLTVTVSLHLLAGERWHCRRHHRGEGYTRVLSIEPVADHAVGGKSLLTLCDIFSSCGHGIFIAFAADRDVMLGPVDDT
jgi:hypothetical protein